MNINNNSNYIQSDSESAFSNEHFEHIKAFIQKDIRVTWEMYASNEGRISVCLDHFVHVNSFGTQGTLTQGLYKYFIDRVGVL